MPFAIHALNVIDVIILLTFLVGIGLLWRSVAICSWASCLHIRSSLWKRLKSFPVPGSTKTLGPLGIVEQALSKKTEISIFRVYNIWHASVKEQLFAS